MARIQVFGSMESAATRVRTRDAGQPASDRRVPGTPSGYELLLAAIGTETSGALIAHCRRSNWDLGNIYIELALHGSAPWQAIGRRIWIDGQLNRARMDELLRVADRLPLLQTLRPDLCLRSQLERLHRPDLE